MVRSGLTGILVTLITMGAVAVPRAANAAVRLGGQVDLGAGSAFAGNDIVEPSDGASVDGRRPATTREAVRLGTGTDPGTDPDTDAVAAPVPADCGIATTTAGLTATCAGGSDSAPISFTATVTASDGSVPTGRVTFATDGLTLGTALLVNGVASLTTSTLPPGVYRIVAYYPGTAELDPSNTPLLIQRVGLGCPCTPTSPAGRIRVWVNGETRSPAPGERVRTQIVFGRVA